MECKPCVTAMLGEQKIDFSERAPFPREQKARERIVIRILDPNVAANGANFFWRRPRPIDPQVEPPAVLHASGVGPQESRFLDNLADKAGVDLDFVRRAADRSFSAMMNTWYDGTSKSAKRQQKTKYLFFQRDKAGFNNLKL